MLASSPAGVLGERGSIVGGGLVGGSEVVTVASGVMGGVSSAAGAIVGGGAVGDTSRVAGNSTYSLSKADLAFPNNEHLLPISTFSTEQGLTVPSSHTQVRPDLFGK